MIAPIALVMLLSSPIPAKFLAANAPLVAEARSIAKTQGDSIWPGFAKTPFPVLLVGELDSFLFCPAGPARGFDTVGTEPFTKCVLKTRKRIFESSLQATFPAVDGISTVVTGTPENTERNATAWISTLLHEHFHQLQTGQRGYYDDVNALNLAGHDQSGMWMLDFPFPYDRPETARAFEDVAHALAGVLRAKGEARFQTRIKAYRKARRIAFASVGTREGRYAEFQLWQEGVARYSEIALAEAAIERSRRGESAYDYSALALNLRLRVLQNLDSFDMAKNARVSFYALGAAEALMLDRLHPDWRKRYFHTGMAMAPLVYDASQ